jgi:hypothetical protein
MAYTNNYTIDKFGAASISADIVNGGTYDGYVNGLYINGVPIDPTSTDWNDIISATETSLIVNQYNGTLNQPVKLVPDEISQDNYYLNKKALDNTQKTIENNLLYTVLSTITQKQKTKVSALTYPMDISLDQDYLSISQYEFSPPQGGSKTKTKAYEGSVILPMPKVSDSNGAEWAESKLSIFGLTAVEAAGGIIRPLSGDSFNATLPDFGKFAKSAAGGAAVAGSLAAESAAKAVNLNVDADSLLARTTGNVANPNAELLFKGPDLRNFTFAYTLVARNADEGANIRRIIKFFKWGMAPKNQSNALLGTPNVFELEYVTKGGEGRVNKFKQMALKRFTTDYAPSGFWVSYEDSQPLAVKIQLEFTELQPIYQSDQGSIDDNVGY